MTDTPDLREALSSAVDALGDVMLEMQRRRLLARPGIGAKEREILERGRPLTDEQVGSLSAAAFEAGVTALAAVGHPGARVFECSPSEEP